jgi:CBS domain-containing protein
MTTKEEIDRKKRAYCLGRLRDARALVLRDGEAFHEAAIALEQIGQVIGNEVRNGLGCYRDTLLDLAEKTGRHEKTGTARLFEAVKEARNMAVHEGAWARHLSSRLIDLFLILEEALMKSQTAEDIMVRSPVIAETWHSVAQVRREMLANSFSCLPIFHDGSWKIIPDSDIMKYLRRSSNFTKWGDIQSENKQRLSATIADAISEVALKPLEAKHCLPSSTIPELVNIMSHNPVLVIEVIGKVKRIVGIVTPFDLL